MVAYPLLPVSESSAGGAEQILWTLERELTSRGWQTEVAACAGSSVAGKLLATGSPPQGDDGFAVREREHAERVIAACAAQPYDIILDHSGHFFRHAARVNTPVLATLHLPRELYAPEIFQSPPPNVFFHCVSQPQLAHFADVAQLLGVVRNGVALERFPFGGPKADYLLWMGRVCPEKAPHLAIAAAQQADMPIILAGQVYPFEWHRQYWERNVAPLIDGHRVRWVELPSFEEKVRLLRQARALLVTSLIGETTSLVSLEAMACGTPVIAFDVGAMRDVVPKQAGFLVPDAKEMAEACRHLSTIHPRDCRNWVEREYSAKTMANAYEALVLTLAFPVSS